MDYLYSTVNYGYSTVTSVVKSPVKVYYYGKSYLYPNDPTVAELISENKDLIESYKEQINKCVSKNGKLEILKRIKILEGINEDLLHAEEVVTNNVISKFEFINMSDVPIEI